MKEEKKPSNVAPRTNRQLNDKPSSQRRALLKAGWIVPVILAADHLIDGVALHATVRPAK
jgi:hypothetical protein